MVLTRFLPRLKPGVSALLTYERADLGDALLLDVIDHDPRRRILALYFKHGSTVA